MTLEELATLREGWDFEAKLAAGRDGRGALPDAFWPTYSAFANTAGGWVALGFREHRDKSLEVVGVEAPDRVEAELWNLLENRQKVSVNLLGRGDVRRENIGGRQVILVHIPRAPRVAQPVYVGVDVWSGTYLRTADGDRQIRDRDRIRRMIADATYATRDDRVLSHFGVADLAIETVTAYRQVFRTMKPDHPWTGLDDTAFLKNLGAWRRDRESGGEGLTVAGLLMFGRAEAIVDALPHYFLDYQERVAGTGAIEWSDRVYPDGRWSGNLYDFFRKVVVKLTADVKIPFQLGLDLYRRDETHVHEALREAFVNALIHADYEGAAPVLIVKAPGRFVFRNPGMPRISLSLIREGGHSDCRNGTLQKMFLMLGIGEKAGSGFSRIERAWREERWAEPALEAAADPDTTTLTLTTASLVSADVNAALRRRFGAALEGLDADAYWALALAQERGAVTHDDLRAVAAGHARDLTLTLQALVRKGMLVRAGRARPLRYGLADSTQSSTQSSAQSSAQITTESGATSASGGDPTGLTIQRAARSRTANISAILAFCDANFRTTEEIARHLARDVRTLRVHYLPQLVAAGLLELAYPDAVTHPQQAYRATHEPRG